MALHTVTRWLALRPAPESGDVYPCGMKRGNSLAIRIPQAVAREAHISEGDSLEIDLDQDGSLVLRSARKRYELSELVAKITPRNRHGETDWGGRRGKESW